MALKTKEEYFDSIRQLNLPVYIMGERVANVDHPMIWPSINCVGVTYDLAQDPHMMIWQQPHRISQAKKLTGSVISIKVRKT